MALVLWYLDVYFYVIMIIVKILRAELWVSLIVYYNYYLNGIDPHEIMNRIICWCVCFCFIHLVNKENILLKFLHFLNFFVSYNLLEL